MIAAGEKPSAVLIVNPNAGRLSDEERAAAVEELGRRFRLEVFRTEARDSAIGIAAGAADEGAELVIAFGGDGHVNEVANGIAGTDSALGIIPGGTMNVFSRALGLPLDPMEAIEHLTASVPNPPRKVSLGKMDNRYFTFSAGCGFDAEAAQRVERDIPSKRRFGELFFYWSAVRVLATSYRHRSPTMILRGPFGEIPAAMAIATNTGPYAWIAGRAVNIAPRVDLEKGLDIFALRSMRIEALPMYAWRTVAGTFAGHNDVFYEHDLDRFEITAVKPFERHVDGEPLGPAERASFSIVRDILKVKA
jgi:diacylglycerol kinase family enzyme